MKKGFTMIELLVVVVIIGVLSSIALPNYMRSVEKTRATEALSVLKSINDASYAFVSEKNECPRDFTRLVISIPGTLSEGNAVLTGKNFVYRLNDATNAPIAGTSCPGATATRLDDTYVIWNPYRRDTGKRRAYACYAKNNDSRAVGICNSLDINSTTGPN